MSNTWKLRDELIPQLERKLRLLDGPRWSSLTDNDRASVMLGNAPPSLLQKHIKTWMEERMPLIHSYTTALLTLLRECKTPPDSPRPTTLRTNETNSSSSLFHHGLSYFMGEGVIEGPVLLSRACSELVFGGLIRKKGPC